VPGRASGVKMVEMAEMGALVSAGEVAVHPDCWCVCLCYFHFAPVNPEDCEMYLLVPAHTGCTKVQRAVKWLCVCTSNCTVFIQTIQTHDVLCSRYLSLSAK